MGESRGMRRREGRISVPCLQGLCSRGAAAGGTEGTASLGFNSTGRKAEHLVKKGALLLTQFGVFVGTPPGITHMLK